MRLRAILDEQTVAIAANDFHVFHRTDETFHATLAAMSGYTGVWSIIQQAKTQMDRYRPLTRPLEVRMAGGAGRAPRGGGCDRGARSGARAAMLEHPNHMMPVLEITRQLRQEFFTAQISGRTQR
jgi:DNA-binding GntR family transcriptional regulator